MKIKKLNGKTASANMHFLADVVMETALINSWGLTESMKKEILSNTEGTPWKLNEVEEMCEECLNNSLAVYLALKALYLGSYGEPDLDFDSVQHYFYNWGLNEEI
jgi:hypothetical protein